MKKNFIMILILIVFVFPLFSDEALSPEHKDWIELVSPIITKIEQEVFSKLKTQRGRAAFIQMFWKQRDPLPETSKNEFFQEYMKRVQFADFNFGRQTSKKGSRTERGYFYILLGPPIERNMYTTQSDLNPLEMWFYKGEQEYGVPPYFYLIFYQSLSIGEFRLYSPGMEGPEKLISPSQYYRGMSRTQAYQIIKEISGDLAGASLSYLPGDARLGTASFSSDTIISGIRSLAEKKFSDSYARNYLYYRDYVETDYSHNFLESTNKVKIFKNGGQFYIHWTLEPSKINFAFYEDRYYSSFQLNMRIEDIAGNLVIEKEDEIPLNVSSENYRQHERSLFAFQDILPIIPGNFKIFFLLKNKTTKDFTSFQTTIFVPEVKSGPYLGNVLLYQDTNQAQKDKLKAFSFNGNQYLFNAQNNFLPQNKIGMYSQIHYLNNKENQSVVFEIFNVNSDSAVHSLKKSLTDAIGPDGVSLDSGFFSLSSLKPGYYQAQVSILDENGIRHLNEKENFILLSQSYPIIPWSYSKQHNPSRSPEHLYILASQYFMTRQYTKARDNLEKILEKTDSSQARMLYGKTLYALGQFQESITNLSPLHQRTQNREAAKVISLCYFALKDWASALVYLEKLMQQAVELSVLNLSAECYINLDQPEKALPLIQKSLELDPSQVKIREMEDRIKK